MIYSVLNARTRQYDYYQTPEPEPWHAPPPPPASTASALGAIPDAVAWPLPPHARKVGSGDEAKGRVAVTKRRSGKPAFGAAALGAIEPALAAAGAIGGMIVAVGLMTKYGK